MGNMYAALAARVLDTATKRGAEYADVQVWDMQQDGILVRSGVVRQVGSGFSIGYSVRALVDGSWGFAASDQLDDKNLDITAAKAVAIARSSAMVAGRIRAVKPSEKYVDEFTTAFEIDPRTISLAQKANDLLAAEKAVHVSPAVVAGFAYMQWWDNNKEFYSTNGSAIKQRLLRGGTGMGAIAVGKGGVVQQRGGPGDFGLFQGGGYEIIKRADLLNNAAIYGAEAVQLAGAPTLPTMTTDLILHGSVLNLQMHESIGHPLELDRALGWEANFSGISWATPDKAGQLKYGSPVMNVYCDNTLPQGMATVGYDDEGTKPERVTLIEGGILKAFESSRDTAAQTNLPKTASVRAQDWGSVPMVRMTNIVLAPGEGTLDDMIADTKDGVMMSGMTSWSIDDHRLNFQFGPQIAWEIKNGKKGRVFKKPTYTGITPNFWGSMDRVAGESEFVVWGTPNCGKGEPEQTGMTTHACSHARFTNVKVGIKADTEAS